MEITFIESNLEIGKKKAWECEFAAQDDFNLHIERVEGGRFLVYQKSVEDGEYAIVDGIVRHDHKDVIDLDMTALVYPKWIKVVSESEVTSAYLTTDGEVVVEGGVSEEGFGEAIAQETLVHFYDGTILVSHTDILLDHAITLTPVGATRIKREEGGDLSLVNFYPTTYATMRFPAKADRTEYVRVYGGSDSGLISPIDTGGTDITYYIRDYMFPLLIENIDTGKSYTIHL